MSAARSDERGARSTVTRAIRTGNGVPLAMQAIHGHSCLDVWWMRLGIRHGAFTRAH